MSTDPDTVLIVDDDPGIRGALRLLLTSVGLASRAFASGEEFLAAPLPETPACVLLDLGMPGMNGLQIQDHLLTTHPDIPVIFLTGTASVPAAVRALKRGAADFIEKPNLQQDRLLRLIGESIAKHREALQRKSEEAVLAERIRSLSPREADVARLAADGKANKVIAIALGISERTVEIHRGRAMRKLKLSSVAELGRLARRLSELPRNEHP